MANSKYDVIALIELVQQRPCLWDKMHEDHKNKILREKGWREIYELLEPGYLELEKEERKRVGESITNKWTNIRDAFYKTVRKKAGQPTKKPYIYAKHLKFLPIAVPADYTAFDTSEMEYDSENELQPSSPTSPPSFNVKLEGSMSSETSEPTYKRTRRGTAALEAAEQDPLFEIKRSIEQSTRLRSNCCKRPDEKEMALLSFLPYVRDMTEMEMMEFQMETLKTIKRIKNGRALHLQIAPANET